MAASVFFHASYLSGAPTLTNAWGSLTALLDACLVNGYGVKAVATLTSTAAGVATVTITGGHAFVIGQVVQIAGAAQSNYNGDWTVLSITSTTFTYQMDVPGTVRTATTTTSITVKTAALGWSKPYSATSKGAYRAATGNRNILLVDNAMRSGYTTTWAKWASVGIVSAMSSISTITGIQAPYDPTNPNRNWSTPGTGGDWGWSKWVHARQYGWLDAGDGGAGNRDWLLIGNDRFFHLFLKQAAAWGGFVHYAFGDVKSYVTSGDATGTLLISSDGSYEAQPGDANEVGVAISLAYRGKWLLRNHTQLGLPVRAAGAPPLNLINGAMASGRGPMPYPHGPDNGLWLMPILLVEEGLNTVRGEVPGLYFTSQYKPVGHGAPFQQVIDGTLRTLMAVGLQGWSEDAGGLVFVDLTGPW